MLTLREFQKELDKLVSSIKNETVIFKDNSQVQRKARIEKSRNDLFYFAEKYFPHYITKKFGEFHFELHRKTETENKILAAAGPRAHGKTVLLAVIKPIWSALFSRRHFIVFVSENSELAKERTASIKLELMYNERLKNDFGEQITGGSFGDFIMKSGTRFLALGYKQPIRGKLHGSSRPDLIIIDDFESHLSINPRISDDKLRYVREEAFGALPPGNKGNIIWLGNLTSKESALYKFKKICDTMNSEDTLSDNDNLQKENSDSNKETLSTQRKNSPLEFLLFKAVKDDGTPLWKEGYTIEELMNIKKAMGTLGFERHFQMNPVFKGKIFKQEWFKYYSEFPDSKDTRTVIYCDPSLGESKYADYKAITVLSLTGEKYYVRDIWVRKESISNMLKKMYHLNSQFKGSKIFMEKNLWQKVLWEFIPPLSKEFGYILPVQGYSNRVSKNSRIEKLQPLFEWGWILFPNTGSEDLERLKEQLCVFPEHPNDDAPDSLSSAVEIIKKVHNQGDFKFKRVKSRKLGGLL